MACVTSLGLPHSSCSKKWSGMPLVWVISCSMVISALSARGIQESAHPIIQAQLALLQPAQGNHGSAQYFGYAGHIVEGVPGDMAEGAAAKHPGTDAHAQACGGIRALLQALLHQGGCFGKGFHGHALPSFCGAGNAACVALPWVILLPSQRGRFPRIRDVLFP